MKRILYSIVPLILVILMTQSCKKDTEGFTKVTIYPIVTINGDEVIFVQKGVAFNDPGANATLDGADVSDNVVVKSTVNVNAPGKYSVVYSMVNEDGFKVEKSRTIYVYDGTTSNIESKIYTVAPGSNRNGSPAFSGYPVVVYQVSPGVFGISDFLGGYYQYRAGYGPSYAAAGEFRLNADNTLSLISSYVPGWGDSLDGLENGIVNLSSETISFTAKYAGQFNFNVILK